MKMRNIRLQHRIFLYFSLLFILSTILFGYYAYQANVQTAEENFTSAVNGSMTQTANGLANLLDEAEKQANLFAGGYTVQESLAGGDVPVLTQYDRYVDLERVINAYEKNYDAFGIRVFIDPVRRFMNDRTRYLPESEVPKDENSSFLFRRNAVLHWSRTPLTNTGGLPGILLSCYRNIVNMNDISIAMGTVSFDVKTEAFSTILRNSSLSENPKLYVIDEVGMGIYDTNNLDSRNEVIVKKETMEKIRLKGSGSLRIDMGNKSSLIVFKKLAHYPFYLAVDIPFTELSKRSKLILTQFMWVALLVLSVCFIVAYLISSGVTRRLKRLSNAMGTIESNQFNIQIPEDINDEIGIINRKFNWMMERIRTLIQDVYQSNYEKKEAELKLLQAQINPHFLYNTLNSVNWLAVKHQAPDISYMVRNLSEFLRLSLHVDGSSTLETELKHTRAYFNIQKYRFEDRIELVDEMSEELFHFEVIPLILQPLVENAILHGILKVEELQGTIYLRGKLDAGVLIMEVSDSGVGITAERLTQIKEALGAERTETMGTGLRNVHRRIQFRYGNQYGLNVFSIPGEGTRCILTLPAVGLPE